MHEHDVSRVASVVRFIHYLVPTPGYRVLVLGEGLDERFQLGLYLRTARIVRGVRLRESSRRPCRTSPCRGPSEFRWFGWGASTSPRRRFRPRRAKAAP